VKFFLLLAFLSTPQDKPVEKCTLSGTVVNAATGEPLNKVRILAEGGGSESGTTPVTTTDAKGRFTLVDLLPGHYRLKGQRNGYLDGAYGARRAEGNGTPIALEAGQEIKDLQIKLTPFGVIAGTVRDADGEPLSRIPVTANRLKFDRGRRRIVEAGGAYTDDLGQYRIPDLPPGRYYVHADAKKAGDFGGSMQMEVETEDHSPKEAGRPQVLLSATYPAVQEVAPGARVTGVDIALTRSSTVPVNGHATAPAGMQINGISLSYANPEDEQLGEHLFTGVSQKGEFTFNAVPPGSYILTAQAIPPAKPFSGAIEMFTEMLQARIPLQVGTSPVEGVRVVIESGAEIAGHIAVDGDERAKLEGPLVQYDDGQSDPLTVWVTQDNSFKLWLAPGHYNVRANALGGADLVVRSIQAQGRDILDEGLTISEPGKIALEIVLSHDGGQLDGIALDADEKPVAGATVLLAPESRLRSRTDLFRQCEADQYGRFTIVGIAPGDYKLFAWDDVEAGAWWDPDFLKRYESQGEAVTIGVKGKAKAKAHLAKEY
jgi:hypothetical protein